MDPTRKLKEAHSPNTARAYTTQWQLWVAYAGDDALPAPTELLYEYLGKLAKTRSMATVRQAAAAIGAVLRINGHEIPKSVRLELERLAKQYPRQPAQVRGLDTQALEQMEARCWDRRGRERPETAQRRATFDVALARVMRDGLLRRSETAAIEWEDIEELADGTGRLIVRYSKTDPTGRGAVVYLGVDAMQALAALPARGSAGIPALRFPACPSYQSVLCTGRIGRGVLRALAARRYDTGSGRRFVRTDRNHGRGPLALDRYARALRAQPKRRPGRRRQISQEKTWN